MVGKRTRFQVSNNMLKWQIGNAILPTCLLLVGENSTSSHLNITMYIHWLIKKKQCTFTEHRDNNIIN